ncbi:hypothetical protein WJX79_005192 [Trebouxia sp. C0005]
MLSSPSNLLNNAVSPCILPVVTPFVTPVGSLKTRRSRSCCRCSAIPVGFGQPGPLGVSNLRPVLPPIPDLQGKDVRANWNAVALAFLGDTVWELYARRRFFYPPTKTSKYYESVMGEVCAEAQERYLEQLMAGPVLSAEEKDVIRWGNNAKITIPKRFSQSGKHAQTYRAATAIECLVGYLYLTDSDRLHQLMTYIGLGDI